MRHFVHALLNLLGSCSFIGENLVFRIDGSDSRFIQFEINHAGLVEYRAGGTVLDSLRHIIDIDVVAKYLLSITILLGNRRAGESNE